MIRSFLRRHFTRTDYFAAVIRYADTRERAYAIAAICRRRLMFMMFTLRAFAYYTCQPARMIHVCFVVFFFRFHAVDITLIATTLAAPLFDTRCFIAFAAAYIAAAIIIAHIVIFSLACRHVLLLRQFQMLPHADESAIHCCLLPPRRRAMSPLSMPDVIF